jgi:hypothetical protein
MTGDRQLPLKKRSFTDLDRAIMIGRLFSQFAEHMNGRFQGRPPPTRSAVLFGGDFHCPAV